MGKSRSPKTDAKEVKVTQKDKTKFRNSSKWREWRNHIKRIFESKDVITGKPLHPGWNCHHLDLRAEHYESITDEDRFIPLNKESHEMLHWIYRYWTKDHSIIDRLEYYLQKMEDTSND